MPDDWITSTEGDLDPDLVEEAGYLGWDPPRRTWGQISIRVIAVLVLVSMVGGALLVLMR